MTQALQQLVQAAEHPRQTIAASMQETGWKAVGCFPVYVPEEIIHAAGLLPVGLWGGKTEFKQVDRYLQSFCCSVMRTNMELGMKGAYDMLSAVVITGCCDSLRAVQANWPVAVPQLRVVSMVYPQNRIEPAATEYMLAKFNIMKAEMEDISGHAVTDAQLEASFAVYEAYRAALREFTALAATHPKTITATVRHKVIKAAYFMEKGAYTKLLVQVNEMLRPLPEEQVAHRVVLTGLLAEPDNFLDLFAENDIGIAADDLAQESRQFRTLSRETGSVMEKLAYRAMDLRGCTFFYEENKSRGEMLVQMAKESGADGIVVCMYKFCDPEEFDYPVYKKEVEAANIPMLYLEIEQQMDSAEQLRTRVQSFAEML